MPLKPGCDDATIQANIETLIGEGKEPDQAAAIAHANCRESKALYIAPRPLSLWEQFKQWGHSHPEPGITVFKGADGLRYMMLVTSNSYKDREQEYITTKALTRYVERSWIADDVCDTENTLRFWHSKGAIGDIVWTDMEGAFLLEAAKEHPDALVDLAMDKEPPRYGNVKAVWDYIEINPDGLKWGASHGFKFPEKEIDLTDRTATYDDIAKFESSTLPLPAAANEITFSGVIDMTDRSSLLDKMVGKEGAADELRKGVQQIAQVLDKAGVEHKAMPASDEKVKALLDKMGSDADAFIGKYWDTPPQGVKDAVLKVIMSFLGQDSEQPAEEMPDHPDEMAMGKSAKLLDTLIQTQQGQAADIQTLTKAVNSLTPLNTLATAFQALQQQVEAQNKDIKTVMSQLGGRPRAVSNATATSEVDDAALKAKVEKVLEPPDKFWGSPAKQAPGAQ